MKIRDALCRELPARVALLLRAGVLSAVLATTAAAGEPKEVGREPVAVASGPYFYDTAEQHDIRVDILARGLSHGYRL
ncbi:MAG: hypothetical protein ABI395_00300, partial [Sphingobium sp.]